MDGRTHFRFVGRWLLNAMVLTALGAVSTTAAGQDKGLEVRAARYYRASGGQTVVQAFCRVPLSSISPLGSSATARGAFRFSLTVRDSTGLTLTTQSWSEQVPGALLAVRGAAMGEPARFRVAPGRYTVEATVTDSATGLVTRGRTVVDAFHGPVGASDLLLGTGLRASTGPADTVPRTGEIWNGALFVQTAGTPTLTPQSAALSYYLELYPARAESVSVTARVLDQGGAQIIAAQPQMLAVAAGGGVTYGTLDLTGLPDGSYRLEISAREDSVVVRSAPFVMGTLATQANLQSTEGLATEDRFSQSTEAGLDSSYMPLVYLMTSQEAGEYSGLTVEGKRRWLRDFWAKRNPVTGGQNSFMDQFYARVQEANHRFREGGASGSSGWRTDRGRIFILYGPPDEHLERRSAGNTNPYEIWKYTRDRALKYVFMDLTRFGNYTLIYTNDLHEPSRPNWEDLLGTDGVQDVNDF